jgi:hypothetical protein
MRPSKPDIDRLGTDQPLWRRLQLMWRLHFGLPATLGLAVLAVGGPVLYNSRDELLDLRGGGSGQTQPTAGMPASPAASIAFRSLEPPAAAPVTLPVPVPVPAAPPLAAGTTQSLQTLINELLPPSSQRGADLGTLLGVARGTGLTVVQSDYMFEASQLPGLARLRVDLALRGSDAQLQRMLALAQEQFPNLAVDAIEWLPGAAKPGRANIGLHVVQFYRAVPMAN